MKAYLKVVIISLVLVLPNLLFAGDSGHGGDVIYCQVTNDPNAPIKEGVYNLDYILTYTASNQNSDIYIPSSWEESRDRILSNLRELDPSYAQIFEKYLDALFNVNDLSKKYVWEESPFGLVDLKDEEMLKKVPENCKNTSGDPRIIQAVRRTTNGSPDVVTFLYDADVLEDLKQSSPLQYSFLLVHEFLWDITKDINKVRRLNRTLHSSHLDNYTKADFKNVVDRLGVHLNENNLNSEKVTEEFLKQIELGNEEFAFYWLNQGANIFQTTDGGSTSLMLAIKKDLTKLAKELIKRKVPINARNQYRDFALVLATKKNNIEVVKALIDAEVELDKEYVHRKTALIVAATMGHREIAKVLIDAGANLDIQDAADQTALIYAVEDGHTEIVKALMDAGANLDIQGEYGLTALIYAASWGHTEIVKALIDAGANLNLLDGYGYTALYYAVANTNWNNVVYLLKAGVNVDEKSYKLAKVNRKKSNLQKEIYKLLRKNR